MTQSQTRRRRRRRRRPRPLRIILPALVLLAVLAFVVRPAGQTALGGTVDASVDYTGDPAANETLVAWAGEEKNVRKILENYQDYPTSLLALLARNRETLDFVADYPRQHEEPAVETLGRSDLGDGVPLLLQWDQRWGYTEYGSDLLAVTGCGPTSLAMVAASLVEDETLTPAAVAQYAEQAGFYVDGSGSSWSLMTDGAAHFGLTGAELPLDEGVMASALERGEPIICAMGPGDFTTAGHFVVLTGYEDGSFFLNDPNSRENSGRSWSYDTLSGQIKCLWSYTA